jgi:hypothetical protein
MIYNFHSDDEILRHIFFEFQSTFSSNKIAKLYGIKKKKHLFLQLHYSVSYQFALIFITAIYRLPVGISAYAYPKY